MTKKEFKKKCKQEKRLSYKLMLSGGIVSAIGLSVVLADMLFIKTFNISVIGYVLGAILAFIGMILDLIGEVMLAKEYKDIKSN